MGVLKGVMLFLIGSAPAFAVDACWLGPLNEKPESHFDPNDLRRVSSADDVPAVLGPLKEHWTLGFHSHSPQTDDYRVIAYAPEAQAIVAYTGCPQEKPYPAQPYPECEQIEVMRYKSPEEKLELWAYRLPGKGRDPKKFPVKVIGPNDGKCTSCHGTPPQAKWEPYNTWPGFFGSRSRDGEDVMRKGSREHKLYQSFTDKIFKDPDSFRRYTGLRWRLNDSKTPREIEPERLKYYLDKGQIPERILHSGTPQPNPELNKMLSVWRGRMIVKKLNQSPDYPKMRHALMAIALGCDAIASEENPAPITDYLPASLAKKSYGELKSHIEQTIKKEQKSIKDEINEDNPFDNEGRYRVVGSAPGDRAERELVNIAYLWQAAGNSFDNWNTAENQRFNFNEGRSAVGPILKTFQEYNDRCDPEMAKYSQYLTYDLFDGVTPKEGVPSTKIKELCTELAFQAKQEKPVAANGPATTRKPASAKKEGAKTHRGGNE